MHFDFFDNVFLVKTQRTPLFFTTTKNPSERGVGQDMLFFAQCDRICLHCVPICIRDDAIHLAAVHRVGHRDAVCVRLDGTLGELR